APSLRTVMEVHISALKQPTELVGLDTIPGFLRTQVLVPRRFRRCPRSASHRLGLEVGRAHERTISEAVGTPRRAGTLASRRVRMGQTYARGIFAAARMSACLPLPSGDQRARRPPRRSRPVAPPDHLGAIVQLLLFRSGRPSAPRSRSSCARYS